MFPILNFFAAFLSCLNWQNPVGDLWRHDAALFAAQGQLSRDGLLHYIQERTPTETELSELPLWIERLGDDEFETRQLASQKLLHLGQTAVPTLQRERKSEDAEVRWRCVECLRELEEESVKLPAAVRLLAASPEPNTAHVLLNYLPFATKRSLEMEILMALASLPAERRPPVSELETLLKDKHSVCRSAAAVLLALSPEESNYRLLEPLLDDPQPEVRLRAAQALLPHGRTEAAAALLRLSQDFAPETATEARCLLAFTHGAAKGDKATDLAIGMDGDGSPLKAHLMGRLRLQCIYQTAYQQRIRALREQESWCSKQTELIQEDERSLRESSQVAEIAERTLQLWGVSRGTVEKVKSEPLVP
jgi:hypothetical protein